MATATHEHATAGIGMEQLPLAAAPEHLAVWLGPDAVAEPPIFGRNGDRLPPVAFSIARFEWFRAQVYLESDPVLQRQMVESTVVSSITGCWLPTPERYISHGRYVPQGDRKAHVSPSGSTSRHRAVVQRTNRAKGKKPLTPEDTWEHYCFPSCSNPDHGEVVPIAENNERKNMAKTFEDNLRMNQPMLTVEGMDWLEPHINDAGEGLVDALLCNRYGAYILEVSNGAIYGHHLPDPVREAMRQAAPYPHKKEKVEVHVGQMSIDPDEMYADLLRRAIQRRRPDPQTLLAA